MKTLQYFILVACIALFAGCATVTPKELVNARSAYQQASAGPAAQLVPAELHKASVALDLAEQSFLKDSDSAKTKDLAYVAQRKSEQAGALGAMAADRASKDKANADFQKQQSEIVKQGKQDLNDSEKRTAEAWTEIDKLAAIKKDKDKSDAELQAQQAEIARHGRQDLIDSEKRTTDAQAELARLAAVKEGKDKSDAELQAQQAEIVRQGRQDLINSEKRTADAQAELAKLAAIKEEERGLVVTLSGSVLFRSAQSTLLSSAQVKLGQVTTALLAVRARNLIVEGHTDSQGSESYNQGLSQRRADAVRDYLVQKGYPADRIQSRGMGKGNPIADNASPEGRANNRRVEIVIERVQASNR
jgi:outer membrane protein OmpA-like peptidoglycan-associated protein